MRVQLFTTVVALAASTVSPRVISTVHQASYADHRFQTRTYFNDEQAHHVVAGLVSQYTAGAPSHFFIDLFSGIGTNASAPRRAALVDAENLHVLFIGRAIFAADIEHVGDGRYKVTFNAHDPGLYRVHVSTYQHRDDPEHKQGSSVHWHKVEGSPFRIRVSQSSGTVVTQRQKPLCTDVDTVGRYVACQSLRSDTCLHEGWMWQPVACRYKVATLDSLHHAHPFWITFAGSSVTRGLFYSLVDQLQPKAVSNLTSSSATYKCWGTLQLSFGRFTITYRDFRLGHLSKDDTLQLNQAYRKKTKFYVDNIVKEMSAFDGRRVFVMELPDPWCKSVHKCARVVESVLEWFQGWNGTIFLVTQPENVTSWHADYAGWIKQLTLHLDKISRNLRTARVAFIDTRAMARPFLHEMEQSYHEGGWSPHHHKPCNSSGHHICSPVTNSLSQMLIQHATIGDAQVDAIVPTFNNHLEFCWQCPARHPVAPWFTEDYSLPVCTSYVSEMID